MYVPVGLCFSVFLVSLEKFDVNLVKNATGVHLYVNDVKGGIPKSKVI